MFTTPLLLATLSLLGAGTASETRSSKPPGGLATTDCQIRCPKTMGNGTIVLPAITHYKTKSGEWENTLECWTTNSTTKNIPEVGNGYRLHWEGGFDAAYQYVFFGDSFMPGHPAPAPLLAVMSAGAGDLRVPSGRCLRVKAGDLFYSVGTLGRQTAWWSNGTVVSDHYFKGGVIPDHKVVPELTLAEAQPPIPPSPYY
ncbi:hypothetical protein F5Y19DRAFT_428329 [Xylariaceae sp. FL1651]|nr:hypothetical protein F5Y19DRAFT_428329 [Xylariaceae sp. FL1651]